MEEVEKVDNSINVERYIYTGCCYRHFKGNLYYIDSISRHTETDELMVNYHALYGDGLAYTRPYTMFIESIPEGSQKDNVTNQKYRFEMIHGKIVYDKEKDCSVYIEE